MAVIKKLRFKLARIGFGFFVAIFAANHVAAEVKVPHEFSSGSPALASEVNENFSALVEDIQAIAEPEKKYSIISSETLDSGLVRTKLYAYEESHYAGQVYFLDAPTQNAGSYLVSEGTQRIVNALGEFQGTYQYFLNPGGTYESPDDSEVSPVSCPDGSQLPRYNQLIRYNYTLVNSRGSFSFSNVGTANAGVYVGCADYAKTFGSSSIEYYYLEGIGAGVYSCVSRVAYYGAFNGGDQVGWSKAYSPSRFEYPNVVSAVFDRSSNGKWGSYYLEIDAPADCLKL